MIKRLLTSFTFGVIGTLGCLVAQDGYSKLKDPYVRANIKRKFKHTKNKITRNKEIEF